MGRIINFKYVVGGVVSVSDFRNKMGNQEFFYTFLSVNQDVGFQ